MSTFKFTFAVALSLSMLTARADAAALTSTLSLVSDNIQLGVSDGQTFVTAEPVIQLGPLVTGNYQFTLFQDPGSGCTFNCPIPRLFAATSAVITSASGGPTINLNAGPNQGGFFNYTTPGSVSTITPTFGSNFQVLGYGTYTLSFFTSLSGSEGTPVPVNGSISIRKSVTFTVAPIPEPSPLPGIVLLGGTFIAVLQRRHKLNQA